MHPYKHTASLFKERGKASKMRGGESIKKTRINSFFFTFLFI